ncbi:some similarities with uniprot [Nakaseomyces bracarensis]|uniref:Some similarities with uniprot n=1 Tax=Nakaseomyces bracarensis TaxID=273131 RepID=A0ABR4NS87_9SACH
MIYNKVFFTILGLIVKFSCATTIEHNTYYSGALPTDGFVVNSNNFLALLDSDTYNFQGPLTINSNAGVFIGSRDNDNNGLSSSFTVPGDLNNNGILVFSNHNKTAGGNLKWTFGSINNYGTMYFDGSSTASKNAFDVDATTQIINKGLIHFSQQPTNWDSYGNLNAPSFINDGTICLNNIKSQTLSSVDGTGCIVVSDDSAYIMQSISHGVVGPQTIFLSGQGSELYCESDSKTDNILVAGFGDGNFITFRTSIDPFRGKWSYDTDTGVLTVKVWPTMTHIFNIGKGYDSGKFKWKQVNNHVAPTLVNNAIYYDGPIPDAANKGDNCLPCKNNIPWIPKIETSSHFFPYSGDVTTTYSTSIQTLTGDDGTVTEKYDYYINTPIIVEISTFLTSGSNSYTTTKSTQQKTIIGDDGKETVRTVYYVETPIVKTVPSTEKTSLMSSYVKPSTSTNDLSTTIISFSSIPASKTTSRTTFISNSPDSDNTTSQKSNNNINISTTVSPDPIISSISIIKSTTTLHFSSSGWDVEEIISYFPKTENLGQVVQGMGTEYFKDRVDAQPLYLSSQTNSSSEVLTKSDNQITSSSNIYGNVTQTTQNSPIITSEPTSSTMFSNSDNRTNSQINSENTRITLSTSLKNPTSTELNNSVPSILSKSDSNLFLNVTISKFLYSTTLTTVTNCHDEICTYTTPFSRNKSFASRDHPSLSTNVKAQSTISASILNKSMVLDDSKLKLHDLYNKSAPSTTTTITTTTTQDLIQTTQKLIVTNSFIASTKTVTFKNTVTASPNNSENNYNISPVISTKTVTAEEIGQVLNKTNTVLVRTTLDTQGSVNGESESETTPITKPISQSTATTNRYPNIVEIQTIQHNNQAVKRISSIRVLVSFIALSAFLIF